MRKGFVLPETGRILSSKPAGLWWVRVFMLTLLIALLADAPLHAAPFAKRFHFVQPDQSEITLWGEGDEFHAVFETVTGYTVLFESSQKAYFYAERSADGKKLVSTGVFAHDPPPQWLEKHLRPDAAAAAAAARQKRQKWATETGVSARWSRLKSRTLQKSEPFPAPSAASGALPAPPSVPTVGNITGLTLLIDFPDEPATIPKSEVESFLNGTNYTGYGNNGSVWKYFYDVSNGNLNYTNLVTLYVRMNQPRSYYNDTSFDCGTQGRLLINDAMAILKSRSDYATSILPTFNDLTTDQYGYVAGFNVFFAGDNSNDVWNHGLWSHSWVLWDPIPLGNGKILAPYEITSAGNALALGTFCHENGHLIAGFPDLYDYDEQSSGSVSIGGAGMFSLMGYGGGGTNPAQVDAYLKLAAGWATATDIDNAAPFAGTLAAAPGAGFNSFYRYRRPDVATEYYLFENRQKAGRDATLPAEGIAIWHVDELGDHNNENTTPNSLHQNYELSLVQADNLFHFQNNGNYGDAYDLYYLGNDAGSYTNRFDDTSSPSARWWDGSDSGLQAGSFGATGMTMSLAFNGTGTYSLCGTVRSGSLTGPALVGATVSIAGKTAVTDSSGAFCVAEIPAGTYTLTIARTNFVTKTVTGYLVNGNQSALNFFLTQATYTMSGTVRQGSATGAVLAGATVAIAGKSAVTSATGTFSITGVAAGSYTLTISKTGFVTKTVTGYLVNGNQSALNFFLTAATYTMSGTVRQGSATGAVLAGATVAIAGKSAATSATGAFSITGIAAGSYTLTISKAGFETKAVTGYSVSGNQSGLVFYLTPVYSMTGTVRQGSTTGAVLAGATVSIAGKTATTSSTGTFSITGIPAGSYTLTVSKYGYLSKATTGYVVSSNRSGLVFFLNVAPLYSMSGTVRQGSTTGAVLAGATVAIAGKTATTSSTGTFSITGIPSGSYPLSISKAGYVTKTVASYAVNGNQSGLVFFLSPTPLYSMSGTVRQGSATGAVLTAATVAIAGKTATTTSSGTFSITAIPAGTYTLTISKAGFVTKTVTGYVVGGNQSALVFYLAPVTYTVSGAVHQGSATGAVLAGATVLIAGKSVVTTSTGTFSITGIPAGSYTLTISKTGFITKTTTGYAVSGNQSGLAFFVSATPTYSLSGTVRHGSVTGAVLPGATVSVAGKSAVSVSTGAFSVTGIAAGTYTGRGTMS